MQTVYFLNPTRTPRNFEWDVAMEALFDTYGARFGGLHGMCNGMHVRNRSGTSKYLLERRYFHVRYSDSPQDVSSQHLEQDAFGKRMYRRSLFPTAPFAVYASDA